jgi:chemotaxis protein MotB
MAMNHAAQIKPSVIEEAATPPPDNEQATMSDKENTAKQISDKLGRLAALDDEMAEVIKNVKIKITPEGVLIETVDEGDNLLFETSSAKLNEPLQRFLKALAPMIVKVGRPVEINGHTDARQFAAGSKLNNWDLSYNRAAAARQILEQNGVPSTQVIGVFARASSQLYEPDNPLSPHNRRLSFLLRINGTNDKAQKVDQLGQDTMGDTAAPTPDLPKTDEPKVDAPKSADKPAAKEPAPKHDEAKSAAKPADKHGHK